MHLQSRIHSSGFSTVAKAKRNRTQVKKRSLTDQLLYSPAQIWRSRLSWRIAMVVFLTILIVQVFTLWITVNSYANDRLAELSDTARTAIVPLMIEDVPDYYTSPLNDTGIRRLLSTTKVRGISIYAADLNFLRSYGEPTTITLSDPNSVTRTLRTNNGDTYETVFRPSALGRPYNIVVRIDASAVQPQVIAYVKQTLTIMMLMSAFVTTVLMVALGRWLLEPVMFMRNNLRVAAEHPENPQLPDSPYDPTDEIGGAIALSHNLIEQNADNIRRIRAAAEDQIHKLAYFDTLTGLPNRTQFVMNLNEHARSRDAADNMTRFAVVALDLDHFKDVNDTMGHNIGDAILRAVGKRLRSSLPESATVARSGEDEFAITVALSGGLVARDIADRVMGVIRSEPFRVFNEQFQIRASIGVATFPDDGIDPDQVLKNADIALNRAKEEGRDQVKEYSEDFDRAVQQRFQMLRDLREALDKNQLDLHYQPQLDLKTGKVIGAEALLRWFKPDNSKEGGAYISPADFIPVAEQSGLIVPIGEWVLAQACEAAAEWNRNGHDIRIAINVSGAQFYQSDLVAYVRDILNKTGLNPKMLELEVTESVFMDDIQHTIHTLQDLHGLGVELAIDDFGTGYSSLSYLRQFPIDRLKIDQSFIRNALNNPDDAAIAKTIVSLGHSLNLKVIAEGVETREHEAFLIKEGCDEVQGFRYSRPIPLVKFKSFITSYDGNLSQFDG
ncbi:putative bifunctional diguanylate cyclase/phosphodiesterase [Micavibrio aeruginosavorus]|uniref:putative bifunctional diguanylate cyclase/phosphodiesterase n=1 Tax=Micavibrio aeruginosavorus TaxID=349221 RepID=UPI003F4A92AE